MLHYKDENIDLLDEANRLLALMQESSKDLSQELRETREARDKFWEAASNFDRDYSALKHATRGYLTHTDQTEQMKTLFLDLSPSWQPQRSPQSDPIQNG